MQMGRSFASGGSQWGSGPNCVSSSSGDFGTSTRRYSVLHPPGSRPASSQQRILVLDCWSPVPRPAWRHNRDRDQPLHPPLLLLLLLLLRLLLRLIPKWRWFLPPKSHTHKKPLCHQRRLLPRKRHLVARMMRLVGRTNTSSRVQYAHGPSLIP